MEAIRKFDIVNGNVRHGQLPSIPSRMSRTWVWLLMIVRVRLGPESNPRS
jgi:hypothetical protein